MITTMIFSMIPLHPYAFAIIISIILLTILFIIFICISLYVHLSCKKRKTEAAIAEKRLLYSSPASITSNRFIFPLSKLSNTNIEEKSTPKIICEKLTSFSINELPSNYKTFDLTKRYRQTSSSDSSYTNSIQHYSQPQSFSFGTIQSKFKPMHSTSSSSILSHNNEIKNSEELSIQSSDSDDIDTESITPTTSSLEYTLTDLFRIDLIYKLFYSINNNQLLFQIIRITPMQLLIEQYFSSFSCKIRLFTNNDKHKNKKFYSKNDPINEVFQFDLDQYNIENSYLKINILGYHKNDKPIEIGQTVLVINQYNYSPNIDLTTSEQYTKSIQIYENRIDMIIRQQAKTENEARALICLGYEDDRCLLHVGLIKILGIQYLLKQPASHFHYRDQIQIKICIIIDGHITEKRKSKLIPIMKGICTFSTSFHFDYISLHKTSVRITICYRRSLISSHSKSISMIEFGSTQLKSQQIFQHWTDTLSAPNRSHVHWHTLEPISANNEN